MPAGPRPPGRYGHTLNILGSKIYIFGGQVEGYFFNDLVAFDLNALQQTTNRWETLIHTPIDGGPPADQVPPARTNHTMVTWGDKLYLFGGTDGVSWFRDVWAYSPHTNSWTQLECNGHIPAPREGHAAALVNDVMYIFGGRNEDGNDLGDLAAFRLSSRRWYTFQNMGPSPSPRSGHSMTTVGRQIVVLAGEPSSAPRDPVELAYAYFLDTNKIRYPPDASSQMPTPERVPVPGRPGAERSALSVAGANAQRMVGSGDFRTRADSSASSVSRLPQATRLPGQLLPIPPGPPPQPPVQQSSARTNGMPTSLQPGRLDGALSPQRDMEARPSFDRGAMTSPQPPFAAMSTARGTPTPQELSLPTSPTFGQQYSLPEQQYDPSDQTRAYKPETYQPSQDPSSGDGMGRSISTRQVNRSDAERAAGAPGKFNDAREPPPNKLRELPREDGGPPDSGIGSSSPALTQQYDDDMAKELERLRSRNAWYASELALARKSGYANRSNESPAVDGRASEMFADDDKPMIEALLKMRGELTHVQEKIASQSRSAAEKIATIERQRDNAINEAVYAKTRLAGQGGPPDGEGGQRSPDQDRNSDMSRRLASSLAAQSELSKRIDHLIQEADRDKKARQLAEEMAEASQKRIAEMESHRQEHSAELESVRTELHEAQRTAREFSASHAEIKSQHEMLSVEKRELDSHMERATSESSEHTLMLTSLRDAVHASTEKAEMLEQKLSDEREQRNELEQQLRRLQTEHAERTSELESASRRLRDAEEMAEKHAQEARTHRTAVLSGLGTVKERSVPTPSPVVVDERVKILQQQVESANGTMRQNQAAADAASEKLRRAEERIAGLEAFQEQASREGLSVRKQLQNAMRENQSLSTLKSELEQKIQSQMLETNALAVQHASLRNVLGERGINASDVRRSRAMDSPNSAGGAGARYSTPDLYRVKELEAQLDASLKSHDEMKSQYEEVSERDERMKREYEEKLTALDHDHQAAVKYLRGTEKMLSKMKQELQRVKAENSELRKRMDKGRDDGSGPNSSRGSAEPSDWEQERARMKEEVADAQAHLKTSVHDLESRISSLQTELSSAISDLQHARSAHDESQRDLNTLHQRSQQSRSDMDRLLRENASLEDRARDAENKVQLLLDQVESSVDNYRRQSRSAPSAGTVGPNGASRHSRSFSEATESADLAGPTGGASAHARDVSDSTLQSQESSGAGVPGGRNSLALDSLATELETLRSHWETANKNRLSDRYDGGHGHGRDSGGSGSGRAGALPRSDAGLAGWRRELEFDGLSDGEDDDHGDATRVNGGAVQLGTR